MLNYTYTRLAKDDIEDIVRMRNEGRSLREIAEWLGVSEPAIRYQCIKLGLSVLCRNWRKEEDEKLQIMRKAGCRLKYISEVLGRTEPAIKNRIRLLKRKDKL